MLFSDQRGGSNMESTLPWMTQHVLHAGQVSYFGVLRRQQYRNISKNQYYHISLVVSWNSIVCVCSFHYEIKCRQACLFYVWFVLTNLFRMVRLLNMTDHTEGTDWNELYSQSIYSRTRYQFYLFWCCIFLILWICNMTTWLCFVWTNLIAINYVHHHKRIVFIDSWMWVFRSVALRLLHYLHGRRNRASNLAIDNQRKLSYFASQYRR